jgi:3-isopropylmalate/(R)-2-methylmalate dehydratase small subunit
MKFERISGRAWTFGDGINTDLLAPGIYMKFPVEEIAKHCLEAVNPVFASSVRSGDVIVAGRNFGLGSSREQAPQALKILGVGAVLAKSYSRIFYRNALNLALPALIFPYADEIAEGGQVEVDLVAGTVRDVATDRVYVVDQIPSHLIQMMEDGGLMPHLAKRFARTSA